MSNCVTIAFDPKEEISHVKDVVDRVGRSAIDWIISNIQPHVFHAVYADG